MTPDELKTYAQNLGFDEVRIAGPSPKTWGRFSEWLKNGFHGEMRYLADRAEERRSASRLLESARSVIVAAKRYTAVDPPSPPSLNEALTPAVSRYAWGDDYHDVVAGGLKKIAAYIEDQSGGRSQARWCVDTAPILEKDFAAQSGVGWVGKHTNILNRRLGNWFFLGVVITTLDLKPDAPASNHCGSCTRCLDACPTRAFPAPYVLDARRCISYLTIELKGPIPREFRKAIGRRIFGCDDCLQACPWNRFAIPAQEAGFFPRPWLQTDDLIQLMRITEEQFRIQFKGSPIKRAKRRGLLRNAAVALGNSRDPRAVPVLVEKLDDAEPLIRGHAAWALGEIGGDQARKALTLGLEKEKDGWVQDEIQEALLP
ncbi:MAG: tRNA epoxyqueuosine(34) reductase QueG [Candidatus Omnitrophica bacterium]|nr:tRNA epoxyqueuosine(34) reductase QueG [Candidatus Omnitrophota bacterium]